MLSSLALVLLMVLYESPLFFIIKGVSELWTTHCYVKAGASEVQLCPTQKRSDWEHSNWLSHPFFSSARARKSKNWLHSVVMALKDHVRKIWISLTFELAVRGQGWELNTLLCLTVTSTYNLNLNAGPADPGEIINFNTRVWRAINMHATRQVLAVNSRM